MGAGALPTTCLSNYTPRPCVAGVLLVFTSAFPETWSGCLSGSRIVSGRAGCLGRSVQRLVETTGVEEHSYNVLFSFKALSTLFLSRSTSYNKFVIGFYLRDGFGSSSSLFFSADQVSTRASQDIPTRVGFPLAHAQAISHARVLKYVSVATSLIRVTSSLRSVLPSVTSHRYYLGYTSSVADVISIRVIHD